MKIKNVSHMGPLFILTAAFLWGIDGVLRRSLFTLPPIVIVFYEHLFGALLIAPFLAMSLRKEKVSPRQWGALVWISILSGVLGTLWFTTALIKVNFISFSVVFLLQKLQPLFATASGVLLLGEKVTRKYILWAGLAIGAAYFVTFPGGVVNFATGSGTIVAAIYALLAAFAWGSSTGVSRYGLLKLSQTTMTGLRFMITTPIALLFVFGMQSSAALSAPTGDQLFRFLIIALSTGMVALWIYYWGLKHTQTKVTTILELLFPLTAVAIDIYYYKHFLAVSQYIAAAVLLFAMYRVALLNRGSHETNA